MINTTQISCSASTYVDKFHPSFNFSNINTLVAGIINNRTLGTNIYKTIISFNISNLKPDMIENAFLYIFVDNINFSGSSINNIGICGNYEHADIKNINWRTFPQEGSTEMLHLSLPKNSNGSYIKINITAILKQLSKFDINYNLILAPIGVKSSIIVKFGSCNSSNPPYLKLEIKEQKDDYSQINNEEKDNDILYESNIDSNDEQLQKVPFGVSNKMLRNSSLESNNDEKKVDTYNEQADVSNKDSDFEKFAARNHFVGNSNNINSRVLDIPAFFTEISNTLSHQSELLDSLKSYNDNSNLKNIFSNMSDKIENFYTEFSDLHQEISSKPWVKYIDLNNAMILKLSQKLDGQSLLLNSIKDIASENCSLSDIEKTNDSIIALSDNMQSLDLLLNEIKEKSSYNSTSEEVNALNSLVTLLLNTLDIQSSDLSSIKEVLQNSSDKNDLDNINTQINSFTGNFENINSILNTIETTVTKSCSKEDLKENNNIINEDLEKTNNLISDLSNSIISISNSIKAVEEITSKMSSSDEINNINKLINELKNSIDTKNIEINDIKENFNNIVTVKDIEAINALISAMQKDNESQISALSAIKSDLTNKIDKNSEILLSLTDIASQNPSCDNIKEFISETIVKSLNVQANDISSTINNSLILQTKDISSIINDSLITQTDDISSVINKSLITQADAVSSIINKFLTSQTDIISSIDDNISNIHAENDLSSIKEALINIMQLLDNNSIKIKSSSNTNETYFKSISDLLEKLNNRLSNFENLNSKLDLFENSSVVLSQNFLDLNREIVKLKGIVLPISENLDLLKTDFNNLKETILNSDHLNSPISESNNAHEINSINNRLSSLSENLQKVMDIISSITIEPLN